MSVISPLISASFSYAPFSSFPRRQRIVLPFEYLIVLLGFVVPLGQGLAGVILHDVALGGADLALDLRNARVDLVDLLLDRGDFLFLRLLLRLQGLSRIRTGKELFV